MRIKNIIPKDDEKDRLDLGGFHFFNGNDGGSNVVDIKVDKIRKGGDMGFSLSDVKNIIDARVRPLEEKVIEVKKDIEKLGVDLKDELHVFLYRDLQ